MLACCSKQNDIALRLRSKLRKSNTTEYHLSRSSFKIQNPSPSSSPSPSASLSNSLSKNKTKKKNKKMEEDVSASTFIPQQTINPRPILETVHGFDASSVSSEKPHTPVDSMSKKVQPQSLLKHEMRAYTSKTNLEKIDKLLPKIYKVRLN